MVPQTTSWVFVVVMLACDVIIAAFNGVYDSNFLCTDITI
jgi:hypothetical protein